MPDAQPPGGGARALTWLRRRVAPERSRALADPAHVARILVLKPHDQLGDFLLATPALRALRGRYPAATLGLLTREFLGPLASRNHDLDRVWILPRVRRAGDLARLLAIVVELARFRPDLAFVMNGVSRSKSADAFAALSRARLVVGRSRVFAGPIPTGAPEDPWAAAVAPGAGRDPVYDLDLEVASRSRHQSERLLDLVRWTGVASPSLELRLDLDEAERASGRARLEEALQAVPPAPRTLGLHPGAANELKCWPLESFVELGAALAQARGDEPPVRLAVFDSPRERGRAAAVVAGLEARGVNAGLVPAAGIEVFAATCAALDLLACNDSGVMHVAAALGVPTVSFHSLGRPWEWAPRNDRAVALYAPGGIGTIPVAAAAEAARALLREFGGI
jgi:ADP-heptose:LPS heptosyltransferase